MTVTNHLGYRALGDDTSARHHDEPVTLLGLLHVVGRHQDAGIVFGAVPDVLPQPSPVQRSNPGGGLVEHEQFRLVGERHSKGDSPLQTQWERPDELVSRVTDARRQRETSSNERRTL